MMAASAGVVSLHVARLAGGAAEELAALAARDASADARARAAAAAAAALRSAAAASEGRAAVPSPDKTHVVFLARRGDVAVAAAAHAEAPALGAEDAAELFEQLEALASQPAEAVAARLAHTLRAVRALFWLLLAQRLVADGGPPARAAADALLRRAVAEAAEARDPLLFGSLLLRAAALWELAGQPEQARGARESGRRQLEAAGPRGAALLQEADEAAARAKAAEAATRERRMSEARRMLEDARRRSSLESAEERTRAELVMARLRMVREKLKGDEEEEDDEEEEPKQEAAAAAAAAAEGGAEARPALSRDLPYLPGPVAGEDFGSAADDADQQQLRPLGAAAPIAAAAAAAAAGGGASSSLSRAKAAKPITPVSRAAKEKDDALKSKRKREEPHPAPAPAPAPAPRPFATPPPQPPQPQPVSAESPRGELFRVAPAPPPAPDVEAAGPAPPPDQQQQLQKQQQEPEQVQLGLRELRQAVVVGGDEEPPQPPQQPPPPPQPQVEEMADKAAPAKPRVSLKIDNVFADLENSFNGLSALLVWPEPRGRDPLRWLAALLPLALVYAAASAAALAVILPAVLVLLIVRTAVVERRVEQFAVRQRVLAAETRLQKTVRLVALLARALPMQFVLVGWPLLAVFVVLPAAGASRRAVWACVGAHVALVALLQALGTYRAVVSFNARKAERLEAFVRDAFGRRDSAAAADDDGAAGSESDGRLAASESAAPLTPKRQHTELRTAESVVNKVNYFRWSKLGNWVALLTLVVDAAQLATFAFQTLCVRETQGGGDGGDADADLQCGTLDLNFMPALFVNVGALRALEARVAEAFTAFGAGVTAALLLLFLTQFLRELRAFGLLKRQGEAAAANARWFFSFCGAIVYGHGELKHVPAFASAAAALLSDTLFIAVCGKLLLVLTCDEGADGTQRLLVDASVVCWEGRHQWLAAVALVSFALYVPLSAMVAPMLVESEDGVGELTTPDERKKDVSVVKPFLSLMVAAKCALLVAATFFGRDDAVVTVAATGVSMLLLFVLTLSWSLQPASRSALQYESMGYHPRFDLLFERLKHASLGEPCLPPSVNIVRTLSFLAGALGAGVALLAWAYPRALGGAVKFALLLGCVAILALVGVAWYRAWRRAVSATFRTKTFQSELELRDKADAAVHEH